MRRDSANGRNYGSETKIAQAKLFDEMLVHRKHRNAGEDKNIVQMSTTLTLSGLPYRPTIETEITRSVRTAHGFERVTFYALGKDKNGDRIPMVYGSDRSFLHWCIDLAIKRNDPFVPLATARSFFKDMGLSSSGENYLSLRNSLNRLSGLGIVAERGDFRHGGIERQVTAIIRHAKLPETMKTVVIDEGLPGICFGDDFFKEIKRKHVPFLWPVLRTLHKKPQMQDYIVFLHRRCTDANSESFIKWSVLREQLWQTDTNPRRLQLRMREAVALYKTAWPELNAVANPDGLMIGPPLRGMHFFPFVTKESKAE
jgi:Plasmid encoded RepA protein